ncbi:hypothetical protein KY332_01575 [Candidatus Woesearchaeota archaeon]|nr:hypothetical protein [Candidatus Woesearchaeota archaeon]
MNKKILIGIMLMFLLVVIPPILSQIEKDPAFRQLVLEGKVKPEGSTGYIITTKKEDPTLDDKYESLVHVKKEKERVYFWNRNSLAWGITEYSSIETAAGILTKEGEYTLVTDTGIETKQLPREKTTVFEAVYQNVKDEKDKFTDTYSNIKDSKEEFEAQLKKDAEGTDYKLVSVKEVTKEVAVISPKKYELRPMAGGQAYWLLINGKRVETLVGENAVLDGRKKIFKLEVSDAKRLAGTNYKPTSFVDGTGKPVYERGGDYYYYKNNALVKNPPELYIKQTKRDAIFDKNADIFIQVDPITKEKLDNVLIRDTDRKEYTTTRAGYQDLVDALKNIDGVKNPVIKEGVLEVQDKDGMVIAKQYKDTVEDIVAEEEARITQSDFKKGEPYKEVIKGDWFTTTIEYQDIKTKEKDKEGNPKLERQIVNHIMNFDSDGTPISAERIYKVDKETGKQKPDTYDIDLKNRNSGEPWEYVIKEKDKSASVVFVDENGKTLDPPMFRGDPDLIQKLKDQGQHRNHAAYTVSLTFDIINYLSAEGQKLAQLGRYDLGSFSNLLPKAENWAKWREDMDKFFAKLGLDIEYWKSEICGRWFDMDPDAKGTVFVDTPGGLKKAAAHIEAKVSSKVILPDGTTQYIYKVSAYVAPAFKEGAEDTVFNIELRKGITYLELLEEDVTRKPGGSWSAAGPGMLFIYNETKFSKACIHLIQRGTFSEFENELENKRYFCTSIPKYD